MNAIIRYPGSKWSIANWIISHFPEHHSYLEPFLGSGAVLFNKQRSNIETANDLDGNVVNLFEWIKKDPERLAHEIYYTPYARQVYDATYDAKPTDSLQQAVNFFIRLNMGHGFRTTSERVGWKNDIQGREKAYAAEDWCNLPERILQAGERLRGVQIENRPAVELMQKFNNKKVLVYLDPPYMPETRHGKQYRHEMYRQEEHEKLLYTAKQHKGPVLISGYPSELYEKELKGWYRDEIYSYTMSNTKKTETLWMNFDPPCRQLDFTDMQEVI